MNEPELSVLLDKIRTVHCELDEEILQKVCDEVASLWEWGIERISDGDIRNAVKFYYRCIVPVNFFIVPASTTGKHVNWHNLPGGIMRHLTECCVGADRELQAEGFVRKDRAGKEFSDPHALDIVLAATVVTDTFKNGSPWGKRSLPNHGEIAAGYWRQIAKNRVDNQTSEQIANAVHWHYGRYTPVPEGCERVELEYLPKLTQIVHRLDMRSSDSNNALIYRPVERIPSRESVRP